MNNISRKVNLTIPSGQTRSEIVELANFSKNGQVVDQAGYTPKGIYIPISTGTSFSFEVSEDGSTFVPLRDAANAAISITKTAAEASAHPLSAGAFMGWGYLRVVSNSAEGSARTITMIGCNV